MKNALILITALCIMLSSCGKKDDTAKLGVNDKDTLIRIASDAFVYGLPLALMDITRRKFTNYETPSGDGAPVNQFANKSEFPDFKFRDVIRPNADTYYSVAWCDVSKDAIVLSLPETNGRYYLMPMLDAYTNVFSSPGSRTTGNAAGNYLITGPRWGGTIPEDIKGQINAPTEMFWIIGRYQVNSKEDGEKVIPIQNKLKITPFKSWGKEYIPPKGTIDPDVPKDDPISVIAKMPIDDFFNYINALMVKNPSKSKDKIAMNLFAKIGVGPGMKFDLDKFDGDTQAEMKKIPNMIFETFDKELAGSKDIFNGWKIIMNGMGFYRTDYNFRALVSYFGLGANLPEDAVYSSSNFDTDGKPYNGANNYIIHFDKGQTPPVYAFWSLTMFDKQGYFIENPINIYAVGHGAPFKYNADGSLDIYIQNLSPGQDLENNWLPAPKGDFNVMMRMYWPDESMLKGTWIPPAIKKQ